MNLQELYEKLKRIHKGKTPPVTIEEVMTATGGNSKGNAHEYLTLLEKEGLVRRVPTGNGKKGLWFLNDK